MEAEHDESVGDLPDLEIPEEPHTPESPLFKPGVVVDLRGGMATLVLPDLVRDAPSVDAAHALDDRAQVALTAWTVDLVHAMARTAPAEPDLTPAQRAQLQLCQDFYERLMAGARPSLPVDATAPAEPEEPDTTHAQRAPPSSPADAAASDTAYQ